MSSIKGNAKISGGTTIYMTTNAEHDQLLSMVINLRVKLIFCLADQRIYEILCEIFVDDHGHLLQIVHVDNC